MKKRFFILFLTLSFFSFVMYSQTIEDMNKIVIGVKFQEGVTRETLLLKNVLEDKLVSFATQSGCSSFDNSVFFVSPNIVIHSVEMAETGMKNVFVVRGELYLTIQDNNSGTVFSSRSFPFKGSATQQEKALNNAVLNISFNQVESLFTEAKEKILFYYLNRKDVIFARAKAYATEGDYDGAIACLMMIPEDLPNLYEQALEEAQYIYELRNEADRQQLAMQQKSHNDSILTFANSMLAMHQPEEALGVLSNYYPGNPEQDGIYKNFVSRAENQIMAAERETKRIEERNYQDERRREDRAFREQSRQYAHLREMDRQSMALRRQTVLATERLTHHNLKVNEQKVKALKQIACEYIRNNPNRVDYIRVRF